MFAFRHPAATLFPALALAAAVALPAAAQPAPAQPSVTVQNPWARASAGQAANGAAYLTLTATAPNRLVAASTPVAERVELHEVINDAGVMKMRAVAAVPLAPATPATLAPGGMHLMLLNLRQRLRQGESFPLTLSFAEGPAVTVQVPVLGVGAQGAVQGAVQGASPAMPHAMPPAAAPGMGGHGH